MKPLRLISLVAVLGLAAFTDAEHKFSIDFPAGWQTPKDDGKGNVQSTAPGELQAVCSASNVEMPDVTAAQADINAKYGAAPLAKADWAKVFGFDEGKIEVSDGTAAIVDGHAVQTTTISLSASVMGAPAKGRFTAHFLTGHMVSAGCVAPTPIFKKVQPLFDKTIMSLKVL